MQRAQLTSGTAKPLPKQAEKGEAFVTIGHARRHRVLKTPSRAVHQQYQPTIYRPTALRIYLRLVRHLEYIRKYPCDHCYAHENSLVIQGNATIHIKEIAGRDFVYANIDTIVKDLEHFNLAICTSIRSGLYDLMLLHEMKGVPTDG